MTDNSKHTLSVRFAGHLQIEATNIELEQARKKASVIHVCAVGRVTIASGADVNTDALTVFSGECLSPPHWSNPQETPRVSNP